MAYVYIFFIISILGLVIYRMISKKSRPSNRYTPYDDITMGNKIDVKRDSPIEDSKHIIQYEENVDVDKND